MNKKLKSDPHYLLIDATEQAKVWIGTDSTHRYLIDWHRRRQDKTHACDHANHIASLVHLETMVMQRGGKDPLKSVTLTDITDWLRIFTENAPASSRRWLALLRWKNHYTALSVDRSTGAVVVFDPHNGGSLGYAAPPMAAVCAVFPAARLLTHWPCLQTDPRDTFCVAWSVRFLCGMLDHPRDRMSHMLYFLCGALSRIPILRRDFVNFLEIDAGYQHPVALSIQRFLAKKLNDRTCRKACEMNNEQATIK